MRNLVKLSLVVLLALPLFACGGNEEPEGVIPQGQLDAMDKAKNVENVLQDAQTKAQKDVDKND